MQSIEPIVDFHDKIVYYNVNGEVIDEERILNSQHPHSYSSIRALQDRKIEYKGTKYLIIEASIVYLQRKFGTLHVTHLKLQPV
jgi:hypothetical protein